MKVIVCGAGQVGANIAAYLSDEDNDVTVIDTNPHLIADINDHLNVSGIVGHASHPEVLARAGADDAELIIAATHVDEVNMMSCQVAHSLFNIPKKIARVREQVYLEKQYMTLFNKENMPIDLVISPEVEVAGAIMDRMTAAGVFNLSHFAEGRISLASVIVDENCPIANTPLRHLTPLFPELSIEIVAIIRGDEKKIADADDEIIAGDEVYFICDNNHLKRCLEVFGKKTQDARRAIVVGGGNIGLLLCEMIEESNSDIDVRLIEKNVQRAHYVSQKLDKTLVLSGDGLSRQIMEEADAQHVEIVVTVMNSDESNILSAIMGKKYGCERAITLLSNSNYIPLTAGMGIDAVVSPRSITVSSILRHIRKGRIRSAHSLRDGFAEVIEIEAIDTSLVVNQRIEKIDFPEGSIVGAILRDDEVIIPRPSTRIRAKDRVVVLAAHDCVHTIETMFAVRPEYF